MSTRRKFYKNSDKFQIQHSCVLKCKTHITGQITGIRSHTKSVKVFSEMILKITLQRKSYVVRKSEPVQSVTCQKEENYECDELLLWVVES
jgi:hypothetical protein